MQQTDLSAGVSTRPDPFFFVFFFCHCSPATSFIQGISGMLPMMLVLAFMYTVCMSIKSLVLEKELRLKEVLRAVGIQNWALWASRFTENIVLLMVPCAFISVMVKVSGDALREESKHKASRRAFRGWFQLIRRRFHVFFYLTTIQLNATGT